MSEVPLYAFFSTENCVPVFLSHFPPRNSPLVIFPRGIGAVRTESWMSPPQVLDGPASGEKGSNSGPIQDPVLKGATCCPTKKLFMRNTGPRLSIVTTGPPWRQPRGK